MIKLNKKAQAILPFFALQLISLMVFFIVILTLLTMAKNVRYTVQDFDEQSATLLAQRRLVASADCFAAELKDITFDEQNELIKGYAVYPGLLDVDKMNDVDYFNCMRKDNYDIFDEVKQGLWDAEQGTGAAFRYSISVYDFENKEYIYGDTNIDDYEEHTVNSILTRVAKKIDNCNFAYLPYRNPMITTGCESYGPGWDCVQFPLFSQTKDPRAVSGRCEKQDNLVQIMGTDYKPIWQYSTEQGIPYTALGDIDVILPLENYAEKTWVPEDPILEEIELGNQYTLTCENNENAQRAVMPVMLKDGEQIHPGLLIMESCGIYGQGYDGTTVLDVTIEAEPGQECAE